MKMVDKKGATELLGRHLKLFSDKVEHSGKIDSIVAAITSGMTLNEAQDVYAENIRALREA